jgi:8-oxo-dGTP diphosphatase
MTNYVLGFVFSDNGSDVVLVLKNKPDWQAGLLNGIGGKVEAGEDSETAMSREFKEECGVSVNPRCWRYFARMSGDGWAVDCYTLSDTDVYFNAKTCESEPVCKMRVDEIPNSSISNVPWLIRFALDHNDGKYPFANVRYSPPYFWRTDDIAEAAKDLQPKCPST